jgi:hypothetical protein
MKKHLLSILLVCGVFAFSSNTTSQTITVLNPNEYYKAPPKTEMVVMDANTFGNYHYTLAKYDTLKAEVKHLDSVLTKQDSSQTQLTHNYESLLFLKQSEINQYQDSYQRLQNSTNDCLKEQKQLQVDYIKIEQKNRRIKTWRNWFMGTTALLGTIIVMSVVK